jgi:hypothetical protein
VASSTFSSARTFVDIVDGVDDAGRDRVAARYGFN